MSSSIGVRLAAYSASAINDVASLRRIVLALSKHFGQGISVETLLEDVEQDFSSHSSVDDAMTRLSSQWTGSFYVRFINDSHERFGHARFLRLRRDQLRMRQHSDDVHEFQMEGNLCDFKACSSLLIEVCETLDAFYGYGCKQDAKSPTAGTDGFLYGIPRFGWMTFVGKGYAQLSHSRLRENFRYLEVSHKPKSLFVRAGLNPQDSELPNVQAELRALEGLIGEERFLPAARSDGPDVEIGGALSMLRWFARTLVHSPSKAAKPPLVDRSGLEWPRP